MDTGLLIWVGVAVVAVLVLLAADTLVLALRASGTALDPLTQPMFWPVHIGLDVLTVMLVLLARNPASTPALTWRQRRQLSKQIRGKQPVDPADLPLARDLARSLVGRAAALRSATECGLCPRAQILPKTASPGPCQGDCRGGVGSSSPF